MRLVIAGGPRTGKSTLAAAIPPGISVHHTDDTIDLGWDEATSAVARWMALPGPWVIEGVAVPRALREALRASPTAPCDQVLWLDTPHTQLTYWQQRMTDECDQVMTEIRGELGRRGVAFVDRITVPPQRPTPQDLAQEWALTRLRHDLERLLDATPSSALMPAILEELARRLAVDDQLAVWLLAGDSGWTSNYVRSRGVIYRDGYLDAALSETLAAHRPAQPSCSAAAV